jgi:protein gp37
MGEATKISWAHNTFNPWWGCLEVSPACDNCYARTLAVRWGFDIWGKDKPRHFFGEKHWNEPVKWNRLAEAQKVRQRVFCASMADVFEDHEGLDRERSKLWTLIDKTPHLDWMLLTKRPKNIMRMYPTRWLLEGKSRPNVWLGVTAENQRRAEERIPELLEIPAAVHWISAEPLLGPINFERWFVGAKHEVTHDGIDAPDGAVVGGEERVGSTWYRRTGIDWVIVGGESGHEARRMDPAWANDIRRQCRVGNVAYHFKQKGRILAAELGCKDREGKTLSEWPTEFQVQEFPKGRKLSYG